MESSGADLKLVFQDSRGPIKYDASVAHMEFTTGWDFRHAMLLGELNRTRARVHQLENCMLGLLLLFVVLAIFGIVKRRGRNGER